MDVPRRIQPSGAKRLRTIANSAGSLRGGTAWGKHVAPPRGSGGGSDMARAAVGSIGQNRITIQWFTDDIAGDAGTITSWGGYDAAFDYGGDSIQLATPDDGRIYLFDEGVYSVQVSVQAVGANTASSDSSISAGCAVFDAPDVEEFGVTLRGQTASSDAGNSAASRTFYSQGRGFSGGGLRFETAVRLQSGDFTGRVWVTAIVQRIT